MGDEVTNVLPQPADANAPIWRYMSFAKFVDLLISQNLYLCRVDLLGDEFEASLPIRSVELEREFFESRIKNPGDLKTLSNFRRWSRGWVFVNCWNLNESESDAMWKVYGLGDEGIAVRSTYKSLAEALASQKGFFLGQVAYINYNEDIISTRNIYFPYIFKRRAFQHEQEVRVLTDRLPWGTGAFEQYIREKRAIGETPMSYDEFPPCQECGVRVEVDIAALLNRIVVSPSSKPWFRDLVESVVRKYGYDFPVRTSGLRGDPVF